MTSFPHNLVLESHALFNFLFRKSKGKDWFTVCILHQYSAGSAVLTIITPCLSRSLTDVAQGSHDTLAYNPDRFPFILEPRCEKTGLWGF